VITSAALLLVIVIGLFSLSSITFIKMAPAPLRRFYARYGIREDGGPASGAIAEPAPEPVST
jgi:trehalose monomycolate/heme transporter